MGRRHGPDYVQERPKQDSVALIDCAHGWCGEVGLGAPESPQPAPVVVHLDHRPRGFCSPGCASRWLIRYELRDVTPIPVEPSPGDVRAWAHSRGIPIGDRGRVPATLVVAYIEAHA